MPQALLYEINTRCWLRQLREQISPDLTLARVPDSVIEAWVHQGFTHIWAMGVWTTGALCRAHAIRYWKPAAMVRHPHLSNDDCDISGSPYAISAYKVSPELGDEDALRVFHEQLHRFGLSLILDFVPNHTGIDHNWLIERPDLFVSSEVERPETFRFALPDSFDEHGAVLSNRSAHHVSGQRQSRWFAHGRDPYFPAWSDTAQLDYRNPDTRAAMIETLLHISKFCDGVRCDMAMLQLNQIFERTWESFPNRWLPLREEFWREAIAAVRRKRPNFCFIAEAYWDKEPELQRLGLDFTYEKWALDLIAESKGEELAMRLETAAERLHRGCWFLENHDEARVAGRFSLEQHRAAAHLLLLTLPGMPLIYEGQEIGWDKFTPVQMNRWPQQKSVDAIARLYQGLLQLRSAARINDGQAVFLSSCGPAVIRVEWTTPRGTFLSMVNLSSSVQDVVCDRTGLQQLAPFATVFEPIAARDRAI